MYRSKTWASLFQREVLGNDWRFTSNAWQSGLSFSPALTAAFCSSLNETKYDVGVVNKIFTARWLDKNAVVFGTKCNKMCVLDVSSGKIDEIPLIYGTGRSDLLDCSCGIHSIAINPSHSLLATGGLQPNDLALYELPTLAPCAIGEGLHTDWLFDICWVDDALLLTGGRDGRIAIWRAPESLIPGPRSYSVSGRTRGTKRSGTAIEGTSRSRPRLTSTSADIDRPVSDLVIPLKPIFDININSQPDDILASNNRVRALAVNTQRLEFAALTLDADLALFDLSRLKMIRSTTVNSVENVCLAYSPTIDCYAVGSRGVVLLVDSRRLGIVKRIRMPSQDCAVRSLSFASVSPTWASTTLMDTPPATATSSSTASNCRDLLTIGTGDGGIMFFNMQTMSFVTICRTLHATNNQFQKSDDDLCQSYPVLSRSVTPHHSLTLDTTPGWFKREEHNDPFIFLPAYWGHRSRHQAIFSHQFDASGLRLFTAGGPLPAALFGNYAAIWQ